jgi:hypothetical protein
VRVGSSLDRNVNGWVTVPPDMKLPDNQQDRDMLARELLIKLQMSPRRCLASLCLRLDQASSDSAPRGS